MVINVQTIAFAMLGDNRCNKYFREVRRKAISHRFGKGHGRVALGGKFKVIAIN